MPRSLLTATFILCALTEPLSAQAETARRFDDRASASSAYTPAYTPSDERRPPFAGQVVSGFAGLFVGSAIGFGVAAAATSPANQDERLFLGALAGAVVGSTVGVHWYSRSQGFASNFAVTLLGSTIGMVTVVAAPVTIPIGGTIAYNLMRRDRTAPDR